MNNINYTNKLIITKLITANFLFLTNITAAENWNVSTLAGSSTGYSDGTGTAAKFKSPYDMTYNGNNLYVVDSDNNRIRKVDTSSAAVSTVAGSDYGFADGKGIAAKFKNSYGITCDANGNLYIADTYNQRIRKIDGSTKVTSIAGDGNTGYLDELGSKAKFKFPRGIAWDKSGNIYVADTNNYCIRRLTPKDDGKSWWVDTIAGSTTGTAGFIDGTGAAARFKSPYDIVCDDASNLYVADTFNNCIRRLTPKDDGKSWRVDTIAGSSIAGFKDGTGKSAKFDRPYGIVCDAASNLYVADTFNNRIRRLTSKNGGKSWRVDTIAGSSTAGFNDGAGKSAKFDGPRGIACDKADNIYVADTNNQRIRKIAKYDVQLTSLGVSHGNQNTTNTNEPTLLENILSYPKSGLRYFSNAMYALLFG